MTRYDPAPLFARLRALGITQTDLADTLGCHHSTITLWHIKGVSERYVDAAAVAVGRTPAELWPEWLDEQIERDQAAARARAAARMAALRASNPDYAERQRAYARRWKAEAPEYVRAQNRAYRLANKARLSAQATERKRRRREEKAS